MTTATKPDKNNRVYATPAFLREVEPGTYQLYRSIMAEEKNPRTGKMETEKVRDMRTRPEAYREAQPGEEEKIVLRTAHPTTGRMMELVEVK